MNSRNSWSVLVALASSLALVACGGGGSSGGGSITISGTAVDDTGAPVSGVNVVLDGDSTTLLTTGSDGAFSFTKVSPPYTLTVKSGTTIDEYHGLRRAAPQIVIGGSGALHTAHLSGAVTGPTFPLPSSTEGILLGATNGVLTAGSADSSGVYSNVNFAWTGPSSVTTDLAGLHVAGSPTGITDYLHFGKRANVTLNDGVNQTGLDFALSSPVTTKTTTLAYSLGIYTTSARASYVMLTAGGAQFFLPGIFNLSAGTLVLPDGGGNLIVTGKDSSGNVAARIGAAVLGGTTTLDLPSSTALANSLPADAATGVSKTPVLSWTPVSGADLYVVTFSGSGLSYHFYLPGDSGTFSIPDYSTLSLALSGSTTYSWSVEAVKSTGLTPDALTDPAEGGFSELSLLRATDLTLYGSADTSFTTAP